MASGGDSGDEDEFLALLDQYLDPPAEPNRRMEGVQIIWVEGDERLGEEHMAHHGVTRKEVEQVLTEVPPFVEAKRSSQYPERTLFWGATRQDRWIFIVCEDWREGEFRYLKPITAFEPSDGAARIGTVSSDELWSMMMKSKKDRGRNVSERTPHDQLAQEAAEWEAGSRTPRGFHDAPDAVPRAHESTPISLRMPKDMLHIIRRFAARDGVGYQVLIKRWLDERIRHEREQLIRQREGAKGAAPSFPLEDRPASEGQHYRAVG